MTSQKPSTGFWAVAFAFLVVMMFATLPSPLYGLYRTRDHLSAFTITVVFAIFAAGTIATLLLEGRIARRFGRRGAMLGGVATMMVAAGLLAVWKTLPGLLIGRLLTGVAIGLAAGVAIPYLIELRALADPQASPIPARNLGTAVNVGALGLGPLIAGCLAQWVTQPLIVPYLVMLVLGAVAINGVLRAPETGRPAVRTVASARPAGPVRWARLPVPAAAGTIAAFAASGLFAGLSGLILATTLQRDLTCAVRGSPVPGLRRGSSSPARHGPAGGLPRPRLRRDLDARGPGAARRRGPSAKPSLALFMISGALIGAGAGAIYKGITGLVLKATPPENRVAMTSALVIAVFVGLSVPVIGAGIALDMGVSTPGTVLGFAIFVALGVSSPAGHCWDARPRALSEPLEQPHPGERGQPVHQLVLEGPVRACAAGSCRRRWYQ